jgi:hypothetical protein
MGYTTDFIGHIDITPSLNEAELAYLDAFRLSRRFDRPGGPYEVPPNPYAEDSGDVDVDTYNAVAPGQPQLWCQWQACWQGCCLAFDGHEKFYQPVRWMEYLIDHFLRPGAEASRTSLAVFEGFTFDHRLDGLVVGCRRDNKELFGIRVTGNVVTTEVLQPADPRYVDYPALPYEVAIDRDRLSSEARRNSGRGRRLRAGSETRDQPKPWRASGGISSRSS